MSATKTRRARTVKPNPDALYVAWDSAWLPHAGDVVVKAGQRLRGDHPAVQYAPWLFLPDGTPDDAIDAHRREKYLEEQDKWRDSASLTSDYEPRIPKPAAAVRDEDAVVAIRGAGDRLPRDHPMVKRDPAAFVDVCNGVPRERAMVALQQLGQDDGEGNVRTVHAGQWLDLDDPLAAINPHQVRRVGFE
jgi:hypothetical protein